MNLDFIGEAVHSFTICYLSWRRQLNSVAVFGTGLWERWGNPAAGPTIIWSFLVLSSGSQRVVVDWNFLPNSRIFVYSWSLLRKIRNRVVHSINGNWISWKLNMNKRRRKYKGFCRFAMSLITVFLLIILALSIVGLICLARSILSSLEKRNEAFFSGFCGNWSHLVLFLWALITVNEFWSLFMEVGCYILRYIWVTIKSTLPELQDI